MPTPRSLLALLLFASLAAPALAQDSHILRLEDTPGDTVWRLQTRVRHTTVITLPANEHILDFVIGDQEYWHLTGAANIAFLKPIAESAETNVALVCESGRIYTFLVAESADLDPHLVVRIADDSASGASRNATAAAHQPAFVARAQVQGFQTMAAAARDAAAAAQADADTRITDARAAAAQDIDTFRSAYPRRIQFPYSLDSDARGWPFLVEAMWHDGQFTYLRSHADESPALYEERDGDPSLIAYDLTENGLYIVRRIIGDGWLQLGKNRVRWRYTPPDSSP